MKRVIFRCLAWPGTVWGRFWAGGWLPLAGLLAATPAVAVTTVTTLGGGPGPQGSRPWGFVNGKTMQYSLFNFPSGLALDPCGTILYIADYTNNTVRAVFDVGNTASSVTGNFASTNDGISHPVGVALDAATNLYVLNRGAGTNGSIVKFDASTYGGGYYWTALGTVASRLTNATALAVDGLANLYVTLQSNTVVRITPAGLQSVVGRITNNGAWLKGVAVLDNGQLALSDAGNHGIWKLDPASGSATAFTGFHGIGDTNGPPAKAAFHTPEMLAKAGGGKLVVADRYNNKVKIVDAAGNVTRLYGMNSNYWRAPASGVFPGLYDGPVNDANEAYGSDEARQPLGVVVSAGGTVYTTEVYYHVLREAVGSTNVTGATNFGVAPMFSGPQGIALDNSGSSLYIADPANNAVQVLNLLNNQTTLFAGTNNGVSLPVSVAVDTNNTIYVLNQGTGANGSILGFDIYANLLGARAAGLAMPTAMTMDGAGNLFVAEQGGNIKVFGAGVSNTLVTITNAGAQLQGIALFDDGTLAVSDAGNHVIYQVNAITKSYGVLAGKLGVSGTNFGVSSNAVRLNAPRQLARAAGNLLVVADAGNNRLVTVTRLGAITNALNAANGNLWFGRAGDPWPSGSYRYGAMVSPVGVAVAANGTVYASEPANLAVRGLVGTGLTPPASLPFGVLPFFGAPQSLALSSASSALYIADQLNNTVQVLNLLNNTTTGFLAAGDGLNAPAALAVDAGDNLYVLNEGSGANGAILRYDPYGTLRGTNAAGLALPAALTLDGYGNLFVAEQAGAVKVFGAGVSNTIVTITNAGTQLAGIALFDDGTIAVSDAGNQVLWQVNAITKTYARLTGTPGVPGASFGSNDVARLRTPRQLSRAAGNLLVIADSGNNRLVTVDRLGSITNALNSTNASIWFGLAGDPWAGSSSRFVPMVSPFGVAVAANGVVYAAEPANSDIRGLLGSGLSAPAAAPYDVLPLFNGPMGLALNNAGSLLYVADQTNHAIQALNLGNNVTAAFLTASNGLNRPAAAAVDAGDNLYVLNQGGGANGSVLKFDRFGNLLSTNASGLAWPTALTLDGYGNVYVAERGGTVRAFGATVTNVFTALTNTGAQLAGIALFDDGIIAVSDAGNHVLWQINPITKAATLLSGTLGVPGSTLGASNFAKFNQPHQLARASANLLVAADSGNNRLVVVDRTGAATNVLSSTNGAIWFGLPGDPYTLASSRFLPMTYPVGVVVGGAGTVYASEVPYATIRSSLATGLTPAPTAPFDVLPYFGAPQGVALNNTGSALYIADPANNAVQLLSLASNLTTNFLNVTHGLNRPWALAVDTNNNVYVLNQGGGADGSLLKFDRFGNLLATLATGLALPAAVALDGGGNAVVAEQGGTVRLFGATQSGLLVSVTNAGVRLQGVAIFDDGTIALSDAGNHVIWQANWLTRACTLLTGTPGVAGATLGASNFARLNAPRQLARAAGNLLVVADGGNNRLVTVDRMGAINTVLDSGNATVWYGVPGDPWGSASARFVPMLAPVGVAVGAGGTVYAAESTYTVIRGLLGTGLSGLSSAPGSVVAFFSSPAGLAVNSAGTAVYLADQSNNAVLVLNLGNNQTSTFLSASNGLARPVALTLDGSGNLWVLNQGSGGNGSILKFDPFGNLLATNARGLALPTAMTVDGSGNFYVAEQGGMIQQFGPGLSNVVATVTNAGVQLQGITLFDDGALVVSDGANQVLWQVNPTTKAVSLLTGAVGVSGNTLGASNYARLNQPRQLTRAAGNLVVTADWGNNRVVVVDRQGTVTNQLISTNAQVWYGLPNDPHGHGDPYFVGMKGPLGVALGTDGGVYVTEPANEALRKILATGLAVASIGGGSGGGSNLMDAPSIFPASGYYPMGQNITVSSIYPDVYYTIDGSVPTTNSARVTMSGNLGVVRWSNPTNDLFGLRVRAFSGTNASAATGGTYVIANSIGIPPAPTADGSIYGGIGSKIVVPVVVNLKSNAWLKTYQFRVEVTANGGAPMVSDEFQPLSIHTNDFIPIITPGGGAGADTNYFERYTNGATMGLTIFSLGGNAPNTFQRSAALTMLEVPIPPDALEGDTYSIAVSYASGTSDGIAAVTLGSMAPAIILVTNVSYLVGDTASARGAWYNAGTFGDTNLDNADVNNAFYAASGLRVPYAFSDAYNAMDAQTPAHGDGFLRLADWLTILNRSLRLDTTNWTRAWSVGGDLMGTPSIAPLPSMTLFSAHAVAGVSSPWYRQALVGVSPVSQAVPGATVAVPVYVKLADGCTLSCLQFRALVQPQNGAPPLSGAPALALAAGVSSPYITQSFVAGESAFGWNLNALSFQSRSSNFLGWLSFAIPATAVAGQTYQVCLTNADGMPNLSTAYTLETRGATVAVLASAPAASLTSDDWKLHFFGSLTAGMAGDLADADGDGVPNWMEYVAGTDPTDAGSRLVFSGAQRQVAGSKPQLSLNWLTAPGKAYEIQWTTNLTRGAWTTLGTVAGDGTVAGCVDTNLSGGGRFYRLHVLP